jgi:predicted phage-related endonuclease
MLLGLDLEEGILRVYARRAGRPVHHNKRTFRPAVRRWMSLTPDAVCIEERRGVDAKLVAFDQRFHWGDTAYDVPQRYILQCAYYMAGLNYPAWDLAALMGHDLMVYSFERNLELECAMLEAVEAWHRRYLVGDEVPEIEASPTADSWLKLRFPRNIADIRHADEDEIALLTEYAQVRAEAKLKAQEQDDLEARLKKAVGDNDGITWAHGKFTWKKPSDSKIVNWEELAKYMLSGYLPDESAAIQARYTALRENSRRLYFRSDLEVG